MACHCILTETMDSSIINFGFIMLLLVLFFLTFMQESLVDKLYYFACTSTLTLPIACRRVRINPRLYLVTFLLKQCDPAINTFFYNGCVVYGRREFLNRVINCSLTCLTTSAAPHPGHLSSVRRLTTAHRPLSSPPPPQPPPTTLNLTPPPTCGSHRHPCQPCARESCANVAVLVCRLIPDTSLMFGVARIILRDYHLCLNFVTMVTKVTAATRIVVQHNVLAMYSLGTKYSAAMLLIIKNVSYRMTNIIAPHTHAHEKAVVYPFVT